MTTYSRIAVALLGLLCSADVAGQARKVQVGYCTPLRNIDAAKAAGFEYLELGTSEIAGLSDADFEPAARASRNSAFRFRSPTCFSPRLSR